jgi:hypothetical protein
MKSMRKLNVVVLMMVVALLVAACGGGGNGSNSNNDNNASSGGNDTAAIEAAAREFIRVSTTADFVSLRELTCEAQRSGIDSLIEQMGGEDALT